MFRTSLFHQISLKTNIKIDTRPSQTQLRTRTRETSRGRENRTREPKRQNPKPYRRAIRKLFHQISWQSKFIC